MKIKNSVVKKNRTFCILLIVFAFLVTLTAVLGANYVRDSADIKVGAVSEKKIKAPREMENTWKTEQNRLAAKDASEKVEPVKERDTTVNEKVLESINHFFLEAEKARLEYEIEIENQAQTPGIQAESQASGGTTSTPFLPAQNLPIHLNESQTNLLLTMSQPDYENFKNQVLNITNVILENGIEELDTKTLFNVKVVIEELDMPGDYKDIAYEIITSYLEPNIIVNEEATIKAKNEVAEDYEKEYYAKGQTIVDEGEIITEEAYYALDSLNMVKSADNIDYYLVLGSTILVSTIFAMIIIYIYTFNKNDFKHKKEMLLIFTLYMAMIFASSFFTPVSYVFNPILFFTILIALLFNPQLSVILNLGVVFIYEFISGGDLAFSLYFIITGTFISLITKYTTERNHIIISTFLTSSISLLTYIGITLLFEKTLTNAIILNGIYAAVVGVFSVVFAVGTVPFWEAVFGVVTPFRLIDLSNPNSFLLRKLTLEAPGTYHHSLIVANLAESAAYEIGANTNLARAGGYYHDIGKLKYPHYFSENQAGKNPHDEMEPYSSAKVIISHLTYGVELAEKYKIPLILKDIIEQHHGNTVVKYFYVKAKEKSPEEQIDENCFRYQSPQPKTKEAAVVMLADTVEAAVRAILPGGKSIDEVEKIIRKLVKEKLDDGQLIDSNMTIKDIEVSIQAFLRVFKGMYHERISYPDDEIINKIEDKE